MTGLTPYQTDSDSGGFVKSGIVTLGSSTRSRYTRSRRCELKTQEVWVRAHLFNAALVEQRRHILCGTGQAGRREPAYFTRVVRLSYITQAILDGRQPRDLTTDKLLAHSRLPLAWHEQRTALGFA